ncbi:MAG: VOC family protein [Candidatus Lambdaproteobacteria bacterium]|nr:VOC family protein [Candidatus Lambdaproteobacteria bacterium]
MGARSPLWPATLHHLRIDSAQPEAMAEFYARVFGLVRHELADGTLALVGGQRRVLIGRGRGKSLNFGAYAVRDQAQLEALRGYIREQGVPVLPAPPCLFREGAMTVADPDGRRVVFGLPREDAGSDARPGRLQHLVVTSRDVAAVAAFYGEALGFVLSDRVLRDNGECTTCFYRSDPEHHSFAVFQADEVRLDHHSVEVPTWNDVRDWGDYLASLRIGIDWGPGRHGPGNNLFFMLRDPDDNWIEISQDLERMPREMVARDWPHTEYTLNTWGRGVLRS